MTPPAFGVVKKKLRERVSELERFAYPPSAEEMGKRRCLFDPGVGRRMVGCLSKLLKAVPGYITSDFLQPKAHFAAMLLDLQHYW